MERKKAAVCPKAGDKILRSWLAEEDFGKTTAEKRVYPPVKFDISRQGRRRRQGRLSRGDRPVIVVFLVRASRRVTKKQDIQPEDGDSVKKRKARLKASAVWKSTAVKWRLDTQPKRLLILAKGAVFAVPRQKRLIPDAPYQAKATSSFSPQGKGGKRECARGKRRGKPVDKIVMQAGK